MKNLLSLRYISNLSIIVTILSYYMNAFDVLFIFIPLLFVNLIIITLLQIFNYDDLMDSLLDNSSLVGSNEKDEPNTKNKYILYSIFLTLLHLLPIVWIMYILQSQELVKIFHPNYMGVFLQSCVVPIIYYYYESTMHIYGKKINYLAFLIIYIWLLMVMCFYLYG